MFALFELSALLLYGAGMEDEAILLMKHGADMNIPDADGTRVIANPKATGVRASSEATPPLLVVPLNDVVVVFVVAGVVVVVVQLLRFLRVTPSWIPDTDIPACMVCLEPFPFFFSRKCHCDRCGRVCCSDCAPSSSSWNGRFCFDCKHYAHYS